MYNLYLFFFEFGAIVAFLAILFRERRQKQMIECLILAMIYGILLEIIDVHLSKSYFYSRDFLLQIYEVPVAIGIGWVIIYYCAKKAAENYRLKWWQEPLLMALIALTVDLALDAVAVRLGFWSWRIPMDQEWFGVPYDNLVGWLAVVWTFSFFMNLSEQNFLKPKLSKLIRYAAIIICPILLSLQITIYVTLAAVFSGRFSLGEILNFQQRRDFSYAYYPSVQEYKGYLFILICSALVVYLVRLIYNNKGRVIARMDYFSSSIVTATHLFFFAGIFTSGIYEKVPILIAISVLMMIAYSAASLFPLYSNGKSSLLKQNKG